MSEKKSLKRAVKAVWDEVKLLRNERAKHYEPNDILAAANQLMERAGELKQLATQLSSLSAMPLMDKAALVTQSPKRKRKAPRSEE